MNTAIDLAEEVRRGLKDAHPDLPKVLEKNLPTAVVAVIEARTANTALIAAHLPFETERDDLRQQWLRRLLSNRSLSAVTIMEPFAKQVLETAATQERTIQLSMDQTENGDRFAVLMVSVRVGDRALPLAWIVEAGAANIGFAVQQQVLEQVGAWLPANAPVMLLADRFYPSAGLQQHGWQYRLRLKSNFLADCRPSDVVTTGVLAAGQRERYESNIMLFEEGILTNIGILHDLGHPEPWIIAMDCQPTRARVLDYASRWCIEPMLSDFKTRGFGLEQSHLENPYRISNLLLLMSLAMFWCVSTGQAQPLTATEQTAQHHASENHWSIRKAYRSALSWFQRGLRVLLMRARNSQPIPRFSPPLII